MNKGLGVVLAVTGLIVLRSRVSEEPVTAAAPTKAPTSVAVIVDPVPKSAGIPPAVEPPTKAPDVPVAPEVTKTEPLPAKLVDVVAELKTAVAVYPEDPSLAGQVQQAEAQIARILKAGVPASEVSEDPGLAIFLEQTREYQAYKAAGGTGTFNKFAYHTDWRNWRTAPALAPAPTKPTVIPAPLPQPTAIPAPVAVITQPGGFYRVEGGQLVEGSAADLYNPAYM